MSKNVFLSEPVTSRQNPTVKAVCSLLDKKARRKEGLFRFDGIKLLCEAVEKGLDIRIVVISSEIDGGVRETLESLLANISNAKIIIVSADLFARLSEENSPEGVITVASFLSEKHKKYCEAELCTVEEKERILLGESLRDPGNLGTVVRSAAALGIDRLIITDDCADIYSPKTVRAAMGGLFSLKIDIVPREELPSLILRLRASGRKIYAAALREDAVDVRDIELRRGDGFVIGNEGHGLSEAVIASADKCAIIPMTDGSESLNAAAAAAICIWETVRRG